MRRLLLTLLVVPLLALLSGAQGRDYSAEDRYALSTPLAAEQSLESLGAYLKQGSTTPIGRARVVYRWVTDRIAYDAPALFGTEYPDQSPEVVLRRRTAVCAGYAKLYRDLCVRCGLEAEYIVGETRHTHEDEAVTIPAGGHAWNAIKLGGRWYLLDPTWGSGDVDYQQQAFHKNFNPYYFLVPPDQLICSHVPDEPRWQLLVKTRTLDEIETLPRVTNYYYRYQVRAVQQRGNLSVARGVRLSFKTGPGVRLRAAIAQGDRYLDSNLTLCQPNGTESWTADALFPHLGDYQVRIFGTDQPEGTGDFDCVAEYQVKARSGTSDQFPLVAGEFSDRRARLLYPRNYHLKSGRRTAIALQVPGAREVLVDDTPLVRGEGDIFQGVILPAPGALVVVVRYDESGMLPAVSFQVD